MQISFLWGKQGRIRSLLEEKKSVCLCSRYWCEEHGLEFLWFVCCNSLHSADLRARGTHRILPVFISVIRTCSSLCGTLSTDWRPVHSSLCFFCFLWLVVFVLVWCIAQYFLHFLSGDMAWNDGLLGFIPYGHPSHCHDLLDDVSVLILGFTKREIIKGATTKLPKYL